ncbi:MAG: tandem-95 repeat protein [Nitrospirae bacterium]|nr:tandem-95 repeat protein [Nitrospirota bacterium]
MDRSWKKTKSSQLATYGIAASLLLGLLCPAVVFAGSLNAPAGPGSQSVSRYTLKNIYDRLYDGTLGTPLPASPFAEPPTGAISPTIKSSDYPLIVPTDYPLNDIMGMLPAVDSTHGAALSEVCNTKTFWGLRSGTGWGPKTGTRTCNRRPKAVDDSATTNEDTMTAGITVLTNDTDDDGDTLSISGFNGTSANGGTISQTGNSLFYTPPTNFNGKDSFQYTVTDGSLTDTGTVTVTVTAANDSPTASAGSFSVSENGILYGNLVGSDPEGSSLTYSIVSNGTHGTASMINGTNAFKYDASAYEPPSQSNVSDSFTFRVYDGSAYSGNATISITINAGNDAPVLATNNTLTVTSGSFAVIQNTSLNVTDVDNNTGQITYTVTALPTKGQLQLRTSGTGCTGTGSWSAVLVNGTFLQADIDNCDVRYNDTAPSSTGADSFTFTVSDGSGGTIGTTTFNINIP